MSRCPDALVILPTPCFASNWCIKHHKAYNPSAQPLVPGVQQKRESSTETLTSPCGFIPCGLTDCSNARTCPRYLRCLYAMKLRVGLAFACPCCSTTNAMVVCSNDSSLYCYSLVSRLGHNNKTGGCSGSLFGVAFQWDPIVRIVGSCCAVRSIRTHCLPPLLVASVTIALFLFCSHCQAIFLIP